MHGKSPDRKCNCKACRMLLNIFIPFTYNYYNYYNYYRYNNNYLVYHYVPSYSEGLKFDDESIEHVLDNYSDINQDGDIIVTTEQGTGIYIYIYIYTFFAHGIFYKFGRV